MCLNTRFSSFVCRLCFALCEIQRKAKKVCFSLSHESSSKYLLCNCTSFTLYPAHSRAGRCHRFSPIFETLHVERWILTPHNRDVVPEGSYQKENDQLPRGEIHSNRAKSQFLSHSATRWNI